MPGAGRSCGSVRTPSIPEDESAGCDAGRGRKAGHVCQNMLLEATGLGLAAVPVGACSDDDLRAALGVGDEELPLYVVPVGHSAADK